MLQPFINNSNESSRSSLLIPILFHENLFIKIRDDQNRPLSNYEIVNKFEFYLLGFFFLNI
ncbi:uncharacterized protein DS421_12g366790 [Arachis hypogaea]|nr:uncharacterized protein DS421_12g366790 [Arachis hypogaea]